jgi:hypothetical protein
VFSGHVSDVCRGRVIPRHEFVDLAVEVAVDDFGQDVGEIRERIDAAEF